MHTIYSNIIEVTVCMNKLTWSYKHKYFLMQNFFSLSPILPLINLKTYVNLWYSITFFNGKEFWAICCTWDVETGMPGHAEVMWYDSRMANVRHELIYRENKNTYSFGYPFLATHRAYELLALRFRDMVWGDLKFKKAYFCRYWQKACSYLAFSSVLNNRIIVDIKKDWKQGSYT